MAEVLVVVAILVALAGVGVIALFSHMRTMHQLEMDGQAKEIFIAAQNHLALAESQSFLGKTDFGTKEPVEEGEHDLGVYYLLVDDATDLIKADSILGEMLPMASMDETARSSGSYIIRYQKSPSIVLDVFYAEKEEKDRRYGITLTDDDYKQPPEIHKCGRLE